MQLYAFLILSGINASTLLKPPPPPPPKLHCKSNVYVAIGCVSIELLLPCFSGAYNTRFALILTISGLGLLHIYFCNFVTELLPLIGVSILFPLDTLKTDGQNLTKFCIHIDIDKILCRIVICEKVKFSNCDFCISFCDYE